MEHHNMSQVELLLATDARCKTLRHGLEQLDVDDLRRLQRHMKVRQPLVVDTYNYDRDSGAWCPLAVALGLHEQPASDGLDDARAKALIVDKGVQKYGSFSLNAISGVPGEFFTGRRYEDLLELVDYVVAQRPAQYV